MATSNNGIMKFFNRDECEKFYKFGKTLGQGSFATVKMATDRNDPSVGKLAVKIIVKTALSQEDEEALQTEVTILEQLDHLNIVKLRQTFDCPARFYMVMELCTGGELFDRIVKKSTYTEDEARKCIIQLSDALEYCHSRGIVHRDIKPENLLYSKSEPDETIKLADFGLAHLLKKDEVLKTACGTPGYVAPEVLTGQGYGSEVDMWSIGVVVYILLCGYPPFYDDSTAILFNMIKKGQYDFNPQYWDAVSDDAKDLITKLLCVDPSQRLTAAGVKGHVWMQSETDVMRSRTLSKMTTNLKAYNAKRRFRGAIMSVQVINYLGAAQLMRASQQADAAALAAASAAAAEAAAEGAASA
eukprot:CAMPEP_0182600334 /NCGR_PEP_ID=MMETSP1324-20130603/90933_1 /TAXON_ID=236786 /ORGANISM="Florenciella sp., Strain RCC1587" /LENGTH=356 /DNA_ID=CAMNT_0024818241 /DNA_START=140 /DNA_END=1210 /DNA_ORIENTATION=-